MGDLLTAPEAMARLRFSSMAAFYSFLARRRRAGFPVTTYRRGRALLFRPADLDDALSVERTKVERLRKGA